MRRGRLAVAAWLAMAVGTCLAQSSSPRPSLLLVTLDTTRADHLGAYGATFAATPNLDALASRGVRFDQALSPAPLTLPSHASLFSGLVPRRHGARNNALTRLDDRPELLAAKLQQAGYRTAAFVSSVVLDRISGLDRGFERYDDSVRVGPRQAFDYVERAASQTNQAVFRYLDDLPAEGKPLFLWVHYFDPHLPYLPPKPYGERFADRPYDGEIAFMDDQFGQLLARVRRQTDALLVVVAGDHGESLGEHGEAAHGVFVYQATQRVPLIVAGAGVPPKKVVRQTVGLIDVAPTILDLLDADPLVDIDGRSVAPLMRGDRVGGRDYELETFFPFFAYGWSPIRALVAGNYKYIDAPRAELYGLGDDPGERSDLIADRAQLAAGLASDLAERTAGDAIVESPADPELAEKRRALESLGYLGGGGRSIEEASIDPKDGIGWIADLEAGRRAYQTGDGKAGIAPLQRLLARNPDNVSALLALAMCHLANDEPEKAVEADRKAAALSPDDDLVRFGLANALVALGDAQPAALVEAGEQYERALDLNPRFADAYLNYASLLEQTEGPAAAFALLSRARSNAVRDPDLEIRIGVLELRRGRIEAAKEAFRRALELHPQSRETLTALAKIHERQGDRAAAAGYYQRLNALGPP